MVIVNLNGGLGNQLYQYAVGRFIAHKLNTELKLDLTDAETSFKAQHHTDYRLGDFNIRENFATPEEIARVKENGALNPTYSELENFQRDIFILGNWMHSEEFFLPIADILRREFTLKNPLHKNSAAWEKKNSVRQMFGRIARSPQRLFERHQYSRCGRNSAGLLSLLRRPTEENFSVRHGVYFLGRFELGAEKFAPRRPDGIC